MGHHKLGLVLCISFLFFMACSPLNEFYINNFSEHPIQISLSLSRSHSNLKICFLKKLITAPSTGDYKKCEGNQIVPAVLENGMLSFALPARSSTFLGTSSMGDLLFKKMIVASADQSIEITEKNYQTHFKIRDSFYGNIANTFDFKDGTSDTRK